jgi:hypothetical protein
VLATNVNNNVTDNVFLAFTMVQQIKTQLSIVTEREKAAVITKAGFKLLKNNANNSSQSSETHSIQCKRHWEAGLRGQKTVARLPI